ncbi:MAG: MurR/RpiR family transcriptional regulator [Clostridia bacterium]|nr:MurR/RpiR family transcriptional regulator [Clostridia bacterium]
MINSFSIVKLKSLKNRSNLAEGRLIDYLTEHTSEAADMTISVLAERADVSYATVCRLVKRLGFEGFKEFKRTLREELSEDDRGMEQLDTRMSRERSVTEIIGNVCGLSISIAKSCKNTVSPKALEEVAAKISNAGFIYFVGFGTAAVTAHYACTKLFRLKVPCAYDSDIIIAKMKVSLLKKGDALFAISSSGRTRGIIELAKPAKESGITVVSLSDFVGTPLSKYSDISFCTTACDSGKYVDEDFPLIQGQINIIDMIYNCCFNSISDSSYVFEKTKSTVRSEKSMEI